MLITNGKDCQAYLVKTKKNTVLENNSQHIKFVQLSIVSAFVLMGGMGLFKQINHKEMYTKERDNRIERSIKTLASRGAILDRNGQYLALTRHFYTPGFNPAAINKDIDKGRLSYDKHLTEEKFNRLAAILNVPVADIKAIVSDRESKWKTLDVKLTEEQAIAIKALKFPGLRLTESLERNYPYKGVFAPVLGFINKAGQGEGLEGVHNEYLTGHDGYQAILVDRYGEVAEFLDSPKNRAVQDGQTLTLSFDARIQQLAYDALSDTLQKHQAKAGSVVVTDAQTGEVLAMVSLPDYDPHHYGDYPQENYRNSAVSSSTEYGSVMKPFIVAKAINDGKIHSNTLFDTRPYKIGDKLISDVHLYPSLTTEGVLQKSSNVGVSKIALKYDAPELYDYYRSLGFGQKTGAGVQGESAPALPQLKEWTPIKKATISYGYAMNVNLLQVAQAYSIFTTDGCLLHSTIYKRNKKAECRQVISPAAAHQMRQMLTSVTQKGGTSESAAIDGYDVAGKSGTAKKYSAEEKAYLDHVYRSSFVGFAPASNPRLIVAVSVDEPQTQGYYGSTVAAPAFKTVMQGGLKLLGVEPTRETSTM